MSSPPAPALRWAHRGDPPLAVVYDVWALGEESQVRAGVLGAQVLLALGLPHAVRPGGLPQGLEESFPNSARLPLFGQSEVQGAVEALKPPEWLAALTHAHPDVMWWCMARHRNNGIAGQPSLPLVYFRAFIPHMQDKVVPFVWTAGARVNHANRAPPWVKVWNTPEERDAALEVMKGGSWFQQALVWARHHHLGQLWSGQEGDEAESARF